MLGSEITRDEIDAALDDAAEDAVAELAGALVGEEASSGDPPAFWTGKKSKGTRFLIILLRDECSRRLGGDDTSWASAGEARSAKTRARVQKSVRANLRDLQGATMAARVETVYL